MYMHVCPRMDVHTHTHAFNLCLFINAVVYHCIDLSFNVSNYISGQYDTITTESRTDGKLFNNLFNNLTVNHFYPQTTISLFVLTNNNNNNSSSDLLSSFIGMILPEANHTERIKKCGMFHTT